MTKERVCANDMASELSKCRDSLDDLSRARDMLELIGMTVRHPSASDAEDHAISTGVEVALDFVRSAESRINAFRAAVRERTGA